MNDIRITSLSAQGTPVIRLRIDGPDVVGNASVYRTVPDARRFAELVFEECDIAESSR